MVGPLNVRDAKPLPSDLEKFVSNLGGHGFIIVSFGSNVASLLPRTVVDMLATAFGKLKPRVVWRLKGNTVERKQGPLSCIDKKSRNAPGQHGGSLQTRFIQSMRAHVITIYGKRTGRP